MLSTYFVSHRGNKNADFSSGSFFIGFDLFLPGTIGPISTETGFSAVASLPGWNKLEIFRLLRFLWDLSPIVNFFAKFLIFAGIFSIQIFKKIRMKKISRGSTRRFLIWSRCRKILFLRNFTCLIHRNEQLIPTSFYLNIDEYDFYWKNLLITDFSTGDVAQW